MDILNAIVNHTLARPKMSLLEKIIYISDFTDPSRSKDYKDTIRDIAIKDIDEAMEYSISYIIDILEKENKYVPKVTYDAYNYYKELNNERTIRKNI